LKKVQSWFAKAIIKTYEALKLVHQFHYEVGLMAPWDFKDNFALIQSNR
jgi:hypothetical protein